jgi:hypothetical protein
MLKLCAGLCVLMGSGVMIYIAGSGVGGHSNGSAPSWVYAHY